MRSWSLAPAPRSRRTDSADAFLQAALGVAPYLVDSANILIWRGVVERLRGSDSLAQLRFRQAVSLIPLNVRGLDQVSPGLQAMYENEVRARLPFSSSSLDEQPVRQSGPAVVYPRQLRHVAGRAVIRAIVDTLGRVDERSIEVIEVPDSGFIAALKQMMAAQIFTPGRRQGRPVRSTVALSIILSPPPRENPTRLVRAAQEQLRARRPDSALTLIDEALDTTTHASEAERVYARLIQGLALRATGRDSVAETSFEAGLAGYRELTTRGIDLAPFLKRLADSIRISRRTAAAAAKPLGRPTALEPVDQQPALVSHPPIRYAPEMQALRIGGTVIVEAALDTTGRVAPSTIKILQSPNPVFDPEARRVVAAAIYRPARVQGRATRVTIRQPITFAAY